MNQALLRKVEVSTAAHRRAQSRLLREVKLRAIEIEKQNEATRRQSLRGWAAFQAKKARRVELALHGINAFCNFGRTHTFRKLLEAQQKESLLVWGGSKSITPGFDMNDIHWRWTSTVHLTVEAVVLRNFTEHSGNYGTTFKMDPWLREPLMQFRYAADDDLLRSRLLWRIATEESLSWELMDDSENFNARYSWDNLFDMLVSCAQPRRFERLLQRVIT